MDFLHRLFAHAAFIAFGLHRNSLGLTRYYQIDTVIAWASFHFNCITQSIKYST